MRRITTVLAVVAAALGSMTLAPSPATAEVIGVGLITDPALSVRANAYGSGTGCTLSDAGTTDKHALPLDGTSFKRSNIKSSTVTDGGGKITALNRSVDATARATKRTNGQLSTIDLSAFGFASIDSQPGQTCYTNTYAEGFISMYFTLVKPQWANITVTSGRQTDAWAQIWEEDDGEPGVEVGNYESGGTSSASTYLPAGTYEFSIGIGWGAYALAGTPGQLREGRGSVSVRLYDAGGAIALPAGAGRSYLTPGPAISCSTQALPTTFTSRGGRVKSATYYVNGVQKKVVRNPAAGQKVTLTGMPKFRRNDVRVRLVVDPPGDVRTATVNVTRSYRACAQSL